MISKVVFKEAIKLAKASTCNYKVAAVLFKGPNIINSKTNSSKFIGYRKDCFCWEPTRHAEINVMHGIQRDVLLESQLFVLRITREDKITCAYPCRACIKAILKAGINKVYYTDWDGKIQKLDLLNINLQGYLKYPK